VVADVVDAVGGGAGAGIGRGAVPVRIRQGDPVAGAEDALHDVVDVGEVAAHPAVVVDVDGFAGEDGPGEEKEGHVGPAPGAVDGKEPQAGGRQAVEVRIGVRHQFVGLLGGGVERNGMVHVVMHREGIVRVEAVDGTAGGIGQVGGARMPAGFEDMQEADQVALDIGAGVRQRVAHAGLRGQMDDPVEGPPGKKGGHGRLVFEGPFHKGKGRAGAQLLQARLFQRHVVVRIQVVKAGDGIAALQEGAGHVVADESGGAGDQDVHVRAAPVGRRGPGAGSTGGRPPPWRSGPGACAPAGPAGSDRVRIPLRWCRAPRPPTRRWC